MSRTYRLLNQVSVVATNNGRPDVITIPEGGVITVHEATAPMGLVSVEWDHRTVRMFAADLRCHTELVAEAAG